MSDATPQIDYTRIGFPSDQVTLQRLRALTPRGRAFSLEDEAGGLDGLHYLERLLASVGFATGLGDSEHIDQAMKAITRLTDLREAREELAVLYVRYGIAEGPETAQELIRRLEGMGSAQARETIGKTRP
jgi:hypothetical protein